MPKRKCEREQNYLGSKEQESYERKQKDKGKKTQKKKIEKARKSYFAVSFQKSEIKFS